jgi:hypothetical protein
MTAGFDYRNTARTFAALLSESSSGSAAAADDILVFLYRLRDGYRVVRSSRPQFPARRFTFLDGLIYTLESDPAAAFASDEYRSVMTALCTDLANGSLLIAPIS